VLIETAGDRIVSVSANTDAPDGSEMLEGAGFAGFANTHSHAFHRLLRGIRNRGDFWSWRDAMYEVAAGLDPDSYRRIAVAAFREMVAAGYTTVVEFHYLHHQPDGTPYDDPNVMADALCDAAVEAGIRLTLLDTCYLSAGFGEPPIGVQRRFADRDAHAWVDRVSQWRAPQGVVAGAAVHSIRAVDPESASVVAEWARGRPLHVHLSEQPAENDACRHTYGASPTRVLAGAGILGPDTTVVHATHIDQDDTALLAETGVTAAICPTTERWLADGIGPTGALAAAGVPLTVGSDSQAVIDPFTEMASLEWHQRLATKTTGTHHEPDLIAAGLGNTRAIGRPEPIGLVTGARADLIAVRMDSSRTAGVEPPGLVFAATAADISTVVVGGRRRAAR
jgi:formiminoglutamate deiminase